MEDQTDSEIQAKQTLLQSEIIDKNYDKTAFINFCLSKKENGDDLNNWSLAELTQIVQEFVQTQTTQEPVAQAPAEPKPEGAKEGEEIKKEDLEKMEKFNAEDQKAFKEKIIDCRKLELTQLNNNKVTVTVRNPKEVEGGVFGSNYVQYEVFTEPFGWTVMRRFSDFWQLRQLLGKHFHSTNVPPLPNKKMGNKRFELPFIMKRMKFLNLFINNVIASETFKASEILYSFLSYEDRGKFESKFKEYSTQSPSMYVEEYKTLDGKAIISHDEGNEKYFINIAKYFRLQEQIMDRLSFSLKMFKNNMNLVIESMQDVTKNFEILHVLNTRVLMKQTITKSYEELGCFFKNWRKIFIKQNDMVKNHMKDFFKYVNFEGKAYTELIVQREDLKSKYTAEASRITAKKEKLYATGDLSKFEVNPDDKTLDRERILHDKPYAFEHMCAADSRGLEKIHNQLGYANKMNMQELKKMIKEYCVRFVDNLKAFNGEFYPSVNDLIGTWSNMETFVQTANVGK